MTEEKKKGSKLLDSSIWLSYFLNSKYEDIIDGNEMIFISILSLFEVQRKLYKSSLSREEIGKCISFMKEKSIILPLTETIADKSALFLAEQEIPSVDSIVYITAVMNKLAVYTEDNDFRGLQNAFVFNK